MSGYNFTDRVRKSLQMAREEAARLHHEYVGTEHILLGLIRERNSVAAAVLSSLGVEPGEIQQKIEATAKQGSAAADAGPELPYTSRAKKALEFAMMEARERDHSYVGTEHLLLGLLREGKGIAGQVLVHSGVTSGRVTAALGPLVTADERMSGARDSSGRTRVWREVDASVVSVAPSSGRSPDRVRLIIAIVALAIAALALVLVVR